jgi:hypothetical protein
VAALLSMTALSGCDDSITGSSTVVGSYTLRTVNGSALPVTVVSGTTTTVYEDGVISLYQGATYAESGRTRVTVNGTTTTVTKAETGSYTLFGASITLTPNGSAQKVAKVSGNDMTFIDAGVTMVYRK